MSLEDQIVSMLEQHGAVVDDHFVLASGRHALQKVELELMFSFPQERRFLLISMLKQIFCSEVGEERIEVLIGPATGAIWLTEGMSTLAFEKFGRIILAMYAKKSAAAVLGRNRFVIPEPWRALLPGRRVAIIDDVSTTGGSPRAVAELVREAGGEPALAVVVWNRGKVTAEQIGVPKLLALVNRVIPSYAPAECPHSACQAVREIQKPHAPTHPLYPKH